MPGPQNIVPLVQPEAARVPAARPAGNVTYHDGPLLTSVQVQAIFWGSGWQQAPPSQLITQTDTFFAAILQSSLMDLLTEYSVPGQTIGRGRYLGSLVAANPILNASVSDTEIQQALQSWIQSAAVVRPTANTLYFVYLPPGVTSTAPWGSSCIQYCGYHNHINGNVFYAVVPYLTCGGCLSGNAVFAALTKVTSHELCEAITDPALNAWWDDASGYEIGDICTDCSGCITQLGPYTIQKEWSNRQNTCALAPLDLHVAGDITATFASQRNHSEFFFRRLDGHLHYFYVQARWLDDSHSFERSGPVGHASAVFETQRSHSSVFVVSQDGFLHFWYVQGGWQLDNQSFLNSGKITGPISAVYERQRNHCSVFVVGSDGLLHFWYVQNSWQLDKTSFAGSGKITGPISAVYEPQRTHCSVFVVDDNGFLNFWYVQGRWRLDNQSFLNSGKITGGISAVYEPQRTHCSVFVVDDNGFLNFCTCKVGGDLTTKASLIQERSQEEFRPSTSLNETTVPFLWWVMTVSCTSGTYKTAGNWIRQALLKPGKSVGPFVLSTRISEAMHLSL